MGVFSISVVGIEAVRMGAFTWELVGGQEEYGRPNKRAHPLRALRGNWYMELESWRKNQKQGLRMRHQ